MNERYKKILRSRLIPLPRKIDFYGEELIDLSAPVWSFSEGVAGSETEIRKAFEQWWKISPQWDIHTAEHPTGPEGYFLEVTPEQIILEFSDLNGLRNGLRTLRQIAEPAGEKIMTGHLVPQMKIEDFPSASFRGVHICVFPETERIELEKQIRLAASLKLNTVILEIWGVFPFESEPDFHWPDTPFSREDFRYLCRLGKELGVAVVPGLNLVGHATWSTGSKSGKFAVLDFHPEYAPLYDPDGWCWCLSNPATRELLDKLVNELCDVFEDPPFFHVGCDEAGGSLASCAECAKHDPAELLIAHLHHFKDLLKARNCRMMIWHDMMVDHDDPRWKGLTAFGSKELGSDRMYHTLSKDIIICDWEYDRPMPEGDYEIAVFFKNNGFSTLLCPCADVKAVYKIGLSVQQNGLDGILGTTWLKNMGPGMSDIYNSLAHAAWNPDHDFRTGGNVMPNFNTILRYVDIDCGIKDYRHFGRLCHYQRSPEKMH